jgi:hypothetical protein
MNEGQTAFLGHVLEPGWSGGGGLALRRRLTGSATEQDHDREHQEAGYEEGEPLHELPLKSLENSTDLRDNKRPGLLFSTRKSVCVIVSECDSVD